jgi:hypothetical protein
MTRNDKAALTLALEQARTESPGRAQQIDSMLEDQPWAEVATFAASCCQSRLLNLDPWQMPPCAGDSEHHPDPDAKKLLEQMLAAGVSRWHPDPMAAIEAARHVVQSVTKRGPQSATGSAATKAGEGAA